MPETFIAWIMFAFFAGGSLGGWIVLYLWAQDKVNGPK